MSYPDECIKFFALNNIKLVHVNKSLPPNPEKKKRKCFGSL